MNLWTPTTYLCISFILIACSSKIEEKAASEQSQLKYSELSYGLKIDMDFKDALEKLQRSDLKKIDKAYQGKMDNLDFTLHLSGNKKLSSWKITWEGEKEAILSFSKRLVNVLETEFKELQGENGYYACRYTSGNAQALLELTIWENKIELINR